MKEFLINLINLQLFANHVNVTTDSSTGNDLSPEMKTFYDMTLIDEAQANLVHDQFGQKRDIPQGAGKTIEFRKFKSLDKALVPLTEGVTPDGSNLDVEAMTANVSQYGDYITQSDVLELTALDNTILQATKILGRQAGLTLDTVTRNILQTTGNHSFASKWSGTTETVVNSREDLDATATLKVDTVMQVVAKFRACNAPTINGDYVAIIHPYVAYDLMRDPEWIEAHKYAAPENLYTGEIGKIAGVRFVQSSEAKIYRGTPLTAGSPTLTVKTAVTSDDDVVVKEAITAADVTAFAARADADKKVWIGGSEYTVSSMTAGDAGSAKITLSAAAASIDANAVIASKGGSYGGLAVFGSIFLADGAYGVTEVTGGGLQTIVKQKGSAGTADPLDQRSSVGWKAIKTAKILIPDYICIVESCSGKFSRTAGNN